MLVCSLVEFPILGYRHAIITPQYILKIPSYQNVLYRPNDPSTAVSEAMEQHSRG